MQPTRLLWREGEYMQGNVTLAMLQAIWMDERILRAGAIPFRWLRGMDKMSAGDLDSVGVRVRADFDKDQYDFFWSAEPDADLKSLRVKDIFDQWSMEGTERVRSKAISISDVVRKSMAARSTIYRALAGKTSGYTCMYTMRGRVPACLWQGMVLGDAYKRAKDNLAYHGFEVAP